MIRSLTPNTSTSGPHTGGQVEYDESRPKLPAACISIEDTELLRRLSLRGHEFNATLKLSCQQLPDKNSRNLVYEIIGCELPNEVVLIGGHTDSWYGLFFIIKI